MPSDHRIQPRRRLALLFLLVTLIPVFALGWLALELVQKDQRLEDQQIQKRVDNAADRIVAASHQRLSELEQHLRDLANGRVAPNHTVAITVEGDRYDRAAASARLLARPSELRGAAARNVRRR